MNMQASPTVKIFRIAELNQLARLLLENHFPLIWVEGEISNLARPASGHWYFTLKDATAQVRCAMFAPKNRFLPFSPDNGMHVLARAKVSLYEGRGDFQLLIEHLELAGDGLLRQAFERLKAQLQAEGLFDLSRKRPLPTLPQTIGVITSPTGAVIRDILTVLRRRCPSIPVIVYPTLVQGQAAAAQIVAAVELANQQALCDVLIVARGGGSLEDLWPFNEEIVARAIANSQIPVISAVGHEVDVTIADFAADQRAPTPSAAAELVSPDQTHWRQSLQQLQLRLIQQITHYLQQQQQQLAWLAARLQHPGQRLQQQAQRLDDLSLSLLRAWQHYLQQQQLALQQIIFKFQRQHPEGLLLSAQWQLERLQNRLHESLSQQLSQTRQVFLQLAQSLQTLSPLATLERGYAIMARADNGKIITHTEQVKIGEKVQAKLGQGELRCEVLEIFS